MSDKTSKYVFSSKKLQPRFVIAILYRTIHLDGRAVTGMTSQIKEPLMLRKTLSDVWSAPRAEDSQICVQGNLEADKKEFSVTRMCHVHFSHIELLKVKDDEFMVAIGLLKGSNKRIRSPPIVFRSKVQTLNLTFSFQYYHHLKGPSEPNILRIMLQQRIKKQHKTFAHAQINLTDIMQSGRTELHLALKMNGKNGEPVYDYAYLYGSIGTYTEDVETVEDAIEWEDYFNEPQSWSDIDGNSDDSSYSSADITADMTEVAGMEKPVLSEQLREGAKQKDVQKDSMVDKKDSPANRRGKIAKVSKLFSAVSHSRGASATKLLVDSDELPSSEVEMFETNYPDEYLRNDSDDETETEVGLPKRHITNEPPRAAKIHFLEAEEGESPVMENFFVFIKTSKKRGQKLETLAKSAGGILRNYIPIQSSSDIEELMIRILNKYENSREASSEEPPKLKIMLAGNDSFVNSFVRVFVELLSKKSSVWYIDHLRFLLIPVGVNVDIARQIASVDSLYRSLFFSQEWEQFFENYSEPFSAETGHKLLHRIEKYVSDAKDLQKFELGEALITQSIKIGTINFAIMSDEGKDKKKEDIEASSLPELELQVDYWISKKKGDAQVSAKGMFTVVGVTRLPGMCNVWRMESQYRPSPTNFAMLLQYRDKKRGFVKATVAKAGMKLESHSRPQTVQSKVTKLTCSLPAESQELLKADINAVIIDGAEWKGVKFISVSPQWGTHVKTFPVCVFDAMNT